jgi:hypothetical protein
LPQPPAPPSRLPRRPPASNPAGFGPPQARARRGLFCARLFGQLAGSLAPLSAWPSAAWRGRATRRAPAPTGYGAGI